MSDELQKTFDRLDEMRSWGGKDEYDPYPNLHALSNARAWVTEAYCHVTGKGLAWIAPNPTLDCDGNVCFELWSGHPKTGDNLTVGVYVEPDQLWYLVDERGACSEGDSLSESLEAVERVIFVHHQETHRREQGLSEVSSHRMLDTEV